MARKKRQKHKLQAKHAQQAQHQPGQRFAEAKVALRAGNTALAIDLATKALNANRDPALRAHGQTLLAEAHFRAAAGLAAPADRLAHLQLAIQLQPDQARLHHHTGATLLRMGRATEAEQALSASLALEPNRPGLRFLHQLARIVNGETWEESGLAEAEVNSLHLAHALSTSVEQADFSDRFADRPLVGQADGLWRLLLQMAADPKSAPAARYATALAAAPQLADSPVAAYYAGVVALRKGDKATALPIWRQLAGAQALNTPWFSENTALLTRDQASVLAEAQQWDAVAALQPSAAETAQDNVLAEVVAAAYFRLGSAAAEAGQWRQAANHWQLANRLVGDRRVAQNLALAHERLGQWLDAATAWRETVRRRPRKSDHPDYLTDRQVAAIWRHAADCYAQVHDSTEEITCLKNALKYAEHDPDLRLRLADACLAAERVDAARNELERLLEIAPDHLQGLSRMALLYQRYDLGDPMPLWRRVVALDATNQDAKDALARCYVELAAGQESQGWLGRLTKRSEKQKVKILQDGLKEIPGHPTLLLVLGRVQVAMGDLRAAQVSLRAAWEAGRMNPDIVGTAMHDLLHAKGEAIVEELLPSARSIPDLLAEFWVDQARQAVKCELGEKWIDCFCQESLARSALRHGDDSPASTFMAICDLLSGEDAPAALRATWEQRARAEAGHAGLGEFIDARHAATAGNRGKALELLRKGRRLAGKAKEQAAVEYFEEIEQILNLASSPFAGLLDQLDPDLLLEILEDLDGGRRRKR